VADKSPAFQFYPKDFLADEKQAVMSCETAGAYMRLMCYAWIEGSIPDDEAACARLAGAERDLFDWVAIRRCFQSGEAGRLVHGRLEREREKQREYSEGRSEAGRRGAAAKWQSHSGANGKNMAKPSSGNGTAIVLPMAKDGSSSSSASSSSSSERTYNADGRLEWFWNHWRSEMLASSGVTLPLNPRSGDLPKLSDAVDQMAAFEDSRILDALRRFMALDTTQAQALNVKAKTVGYFVMALPRLLERQASVGTTARTAGNVESLRNFVAAGGQHD
jgi:uncharacterized protein YdaU (DUF1376 family)